MNKSIARDDNDSGVALRQVFGTIHILRKQLWGRGLYNCLFSVLKELKTTLSRGLIRRQRLHQTSDPNFEIKATI